MTPVNRYVAFRMEISSDLVLPELSIRQGEESVDPCIEIKRSDHTLWPLSEASPTTPPLGLSP